MIEETRLLSLQLLQQALTGVDAEIKLVELEYKSKLEPLYAKRRSLLARAAFAESADDVRSSAPVPKSLQEMILLALSDPNKPWMRTSEIVAVLKEKYGTNMSSNSVSSTLTLLKDKKLIKRHGRLVSLASQSTEEPNGVDAANIDPVKTT
ncbi:MAG: hypothetical protein WAU68_16530 [Vitreimonas sp.]